MKTETSWNWGLGLALAVLPLATGCDQQSANSAPAIDTSTNQPLAPAMTVITNAASPEAAEQGLEGAPGQVFSAASPPAQSLNLGGPASEIAKLAQAGLDERVMLSYVTNCPHTFNLSSDAIIYLNDIGVPSTVVTAMIQHDQSIKEAGAQFATTPNEPVPAPGPAAPYSASNEAAATSESQPPPPEVVESGLSPEQMNGAYTYFYDTLAPYGNWIYVGGYGMCWQPTVVVMNPYWQPYGDRGHWLYTDCGWYWGSDYSWGWAPFHYGRWFHHQRWGWCWAPDTVWGPAWVSWRSSPGYCGWAPLPPAACYTPGIGFTYLGRHVGFSFGFGLSASAFTVVSLDHFTDPHWHQHRMPAHEVGGFYNHSKVGNRIFENRGTLVNEGIPVSSVAAATHRQIPRVHIRDGGDVASARISEIGRDSGTLAVYRVKAPTPTHQTPLVGQGIRPKPGVQAGTRPPGGGSPPRIETGAGRPAFGTVLSTPRGAEIRPGPGNQPSTPAQNKERLAESSHVSGNAPAAATTAPQMAPVRYPSSPATGARPSGQRSPAQPVPNQAAQPAAPGRQLPMRNQSVVVIRDQPRPTIRAESSPSVQSQPTPQNQRILRQEAPKYQQQDQRSFTQSAIPAQTHPPARAYQWPPAAEPREQQRWYPPVQRAPDAPRPQPAPAAPQVQTRSAPAAPQTAPSSAPRNYSAPTPARGSSSQSNNSGHNH